MEILAPDVEMVAFDVEGPRTVNVDAILPLLIVIPLPEVALVVSVDVDPSVS